MSNDDVGLSHYRRPVDDANKLGPLGACKRMFKCHLSENESAVSIFQLTDSDINLSAVEVNKNGIHMYDYNELIIGNRK